LNHSFEFSKLDACRSSFIVSHVLLLLYPIICFGMHIICCRYRQLMLVKKNFYKVHTCLLYVHICEVNHLTLVHVCQFVKVISGHCDELELIVAMSLQLFFIITCTWHM
jgi:hypothetical protein